MKNFQELILKHFFKVATLLIIIMGFMYVLSPFILYFFFGGILALAMNNFILIIMAKLNCNRRKAINVLCLALIMSGVLPSIVFLLRGASILSRFFSTQSFSLLNESINQKIFFVIQKIATTLQLDTFLIQEKFSLVLKEVSTFILRISSGALAQIPDLLLGSLVMGVTFFYYLLKADEIRLFFDKYFLFEEQRANQFIKILQSSCREVFFTNVLTGILQSLIVSLGAYFCGIGDFYITFVITFVLSFIPIAGAAPMAFLIALIAFIEQKIGAGIVMVIIGMISGIADNIIRPYLASLGAVEVPAFVGFLAVIGGIIVLGLPGLFVGPLLASFVYGLVPIILDEYFTPTKLEQAKENT